MKVLQSLKIASLAAAVVLILGASSWVSAANAHQSAAYQTSATSEATSTVTATPIDPEQAVTLLSGTAAQSPLDNQDLSYRLFSFKGQANELVNITATILTGNMSLNVSVTSQTGIDVAAASGNFVTGFVLTVKLPQDGNYQIRVDSHAPGAGDFAAGTISVQYADAPAVSAATLSAKATAAATATK